jgi:hypothetical protein
VELIILDKPINMIKSIGQLKKINSKVTMTFNEVQLEKAFIELLDTEEITISCFLKNLKYLQ